MATSLVDNGTTIVVTIRTGNGQPNVFTALGGQTNVSWDETGAEIDVSSKGDAGDFQPISGQKKTVLNLTDFIVPSDAAFAEIQNRIRTRQPIFVRRQFKGADKEQAIAFVTSLTQTGAVEEAVTADITMTLQGGWQAINDVFTFDNSNITFDNDMITFDNAII